MPTQLRIVLAAIMLALLLLVSLLPDEVLSKETNGYIPSPASELQFAAPTNCTGYSLLLLAQVPIPERLFFLAMEAIACADYSTALGHLRRALAHDPLNGSYHFWINRVEQTLKTP
jgi:hypothetical protein